MKASDNEFPKLLLAEGAAPATPGTGLSVIYTKTDKLPYFMDDTGAEISLAGDVVGPASSTDSEVALFDGATGKLLKGGGALGTAAAADTGDFATAAQGALADSATQPGDLATVATTGDVGDLTGFPGGTTDFLRADGTFAVPAGGGGGGGLVLIGSATAGVGGVASLSVGSIPETYSALWIIYNGRGLAAATSTDLRFRFNGDTGANYDYQTIHAYSTGSGAAQAIGQTSAVLGNVASATAPANRSGTMQALIPEYANTRFDKQATSTFGVTMGTGTFAVGAGAQSACWRPATPVAITSVEAFLASGNHAEGSVLRVYGV